MVPEYLKVLKITFIVFANFRVPLLITELLESGKDLLLRVYNACHTKSSMFI